MYAFQSKNLIGQSHSPWYKKNHAVYLNLNIPSKNLIHSFQSYEYNERNPLIYQYYNYAVH